MERKTFKLLFDTWFNPIRTYLLFRCGNEEVATDLAQETFMRIWEKQMDLTPESIPAILYKIAGNLFISRYRKEKTAQQYTLSLTNHSTVLTPEEELEFNELTKIYETALQKLPETQRTVFLMNRMESLKYREIAERLQISTKAVEKRMSNALSSLRKAIQ